MTENVLGLNLRSLWSDRAYSNTSLSHSWLNNNIKVFKTRTQEEAFLNYSSEHEINFRMYLDDPNLRMENNSAERPLRKVVLGRKNWLFIGSKRAGEAAGNLISLVQTCRTLNINPPEYLEDIFRRLPSQPHKNISELLPDQWKKLKRNV